MLTKKVPKVPTNFICKFCDYKTCRKSQYDRHLLTAKHKMLTQKVPKVPHETVTNYTQDISSHKNKYIPLLLDDKPKMLTNVDKMLTEFSSVPKINICDCGKTFKHRQSLHVHKKKCDVENNSFVEEKQTNNSTDKDLIIMLIKQNTELIKETSNCKNMMMNQSNVIMKILEKGNSNITTHTNSHNKAFNLNLFLNETCKDAMNIMDFVDSIKLQLTDLEKVGDVGYVEGISNIIVKNLQDLDVNKRPVHCTDKKRETMYIKHDNKWEKDEERLKLHKVVRKVACKNQNLIPTFKEKHPDCGKYNSKFSDQYNKIVVESMGGTGDNDYEKEEKIIQNISKQVFIEKDM